MKEEVKLTFNQAYLEKVILEHIFNTYKDTLGVKDVSEIEWNDYSFAIYDGLWFTKKTTKK